MTKPCKGLTDSPKAIEASNEKFKTFDTFLAFLPQTPASYPIQ